MHIKSVDFYIKSLKSEVFARAPELLIGKKVEFYFQPNKIENRIDGRYALNGRVAVQIDDNARLDSMKVVGYVTKKDNLIIILKE